MGSLPLAPPRKPKDLGRKPYKRSQGDDWGQQRRGDKKKGRKEGRRERVRERRREVFLASM